MNDMKKKKLIGASIWTFIGLFFWFVAPSLYMAYLWDDTLEGMVIMGSIGYLGFAATIGGVVSLIVRAIKNYEEE